MTNKTFYRNLKKYSRLFNWSVDLYGPIRGYSKETYNVFCPITAVCYAMTNKIYNTTNFQKAANEIGLDQGKALNIVLSADGYSGCRVNQRKAILKYTNLDRPAVGL